MDTGELMQVSEGTPAVHEWKELLFVERSANGCIPLAKEIYLQRMKQNLWIPHHGSSWWLGVGGSLSLYKLSASLQQSFRERHIKEKMLTSFKGGCSDRRVGILPLSLAKEQGKLPSRYCRRKRASSKGAIWHCVYCNPQHFGSKSIALS